MGDSSEGTPMKFLRMQGLGKESDAKRMAKLKRGSLSGLDVRKTRPGLNTFVALGKSVPEGLSTLSFDLRLEPEAIKMEATEEPEEATPGTPPRPQRDAPAMVTEKEVLRKASSVVVEEGSDEEDES